MMDFDQMVRNVLWEANSAAQAGATPTQTPPGTTANTEEQQVEVQAQNIFNFLENDGRFSNLQSVWSKTFNASYQFCTNEELNSIISTVLSDRTRGSGTGKTYEKFKKLENIFPILDLVAQLYDRNFKRVEGADKAAANKTYTDFLDRLSKQKAQNINIKPLDYVPLNPWVSNIKSAYLSGSGELLSKLRYESIPKNNSFYQAIIYLLEIRKKALIPKLSNPLKFVNGKGEIDKILLTPWTIVSGKYTINDQKIKAMYDQVTVDQLVSLSLAAYQLYVQQLSLIVGNEEDLAKLKTDPTKYNQFMGVQGAKEFTWAINESLSFEETFNLLTFEMINTDQPDLVTNNEESSLKPFETKTNVYKYDIQHLEAADSNFNIEQAAALKEEIKKFANYIKTKEGRDVLGGLTKIAQAASLGVKNMGT